VIELASACVLIWRLNVELCHGQVFSEDVERTASKIGGSLLFALAMSRPQAPNGPGNNVGRQHRNLASRKQGHDGDSQQRDDHPRKRKASQLGSQAMRADAVESITCGWLSLVVVIGLIANLLRGGRMP
jgi:hypothetical protein